jgi:uncharacterized protein
VEPVDADRSDLDLSPAEVRVLGCLVEKELTTPDQYPLTLNALVLACNQRSNREPVLNLSEQTVSEAVTSAKTKGLVRFIHPSHGRSALRYSHVLNDALGVSQRQIALIAVMMLRGPQTPGELRARTDRMADFADLDDLERELERLCGPELKLVERLGRRPGQSQDRYRHLLGNGDAATEDRFESTEEFARPPDPSVRQSGLAELREEIATLRQEMAELRDGLDDLRRQLGG